jgi:hypothetical protein
MDLEILMHNVRNNCIIYLIVFLNVFNLCICILLKNSGNKITKVCKEAKIRKLKTIKD